eukprot:3161904-Rhodomonas_salina.1
MQYCRGHVEVQVRGVGNKGGRADGRGCGGQVQMLLRTFAELKSNEGHKRYVAFRNARGQ